MMTPQNKRIGGAAITAAAVAALAAFAGPLEGTRYTPYYDPPGILTVCKGHTGVDVIKGKRYSDAECEKFILEDAREALEIVERCAPGLPPNVMIAFGDAVFNMGSKIVCDTEHSTAARLLKSGDIEGACNQLPRWNRANVAGVMVPLPGLTKRREKERLLCLS